MMGTRFETEAKGNLEMAYNNNQYTAAQPTNQIPLMHTVETFHDHPKCQA